jgi:hypothetical protein
MNAAPVHARAPDLHLCAYHSDCADDMCADHPIDHSVAGLAYVDGSKCRDRESRWQLQQTRSLRQVANAHRVRSNAIYVHTHSAIRIQCQNL